ncbi:XdhC family protein [Thalassotalea marina]|uniref:Xanthine and CO dehydrogenase family maturation factor XdhC/CoxF family protein n=1 Tax=Thalassotalea marina TaxID=1673741 RepID=A0A919BGD3_9GAMM|nr:XdhC/CoxI family protein [Thalassotalea marina]GHF89740.1 xanthine and CO dehydrogenase family maturation factor XdhC/CoxF family protein [Thalassotalea marina]
MSTSLKDILASWYPLKDQTDWVLCTLYKTQGSSYRKSGAMMMFSGDGRQLGLLSGGCLEGDIQRRAKQVMSTQLATTVTYDATDEDDLTFQLGIGCGGIVHILMQPVSHNNHYLALDVLFDTLQNEGCGLYQQEIPDTQRPAVGKFEAIDHDGRWSVDRKTTLFSENDTTWLHTYIYPDPHLLIVGGGYDARPLSSLAKQLGWVVSVWDSRPANARKAYFKEADHILNGTVEALADFAKQHKIAAIVFMCHSVSLDAKALATLHQIPASYLGLLGPNHRKQQVIEASAIDVKNLSTPLAGPIGLNIGGETPESIALAVLAEIHAILCQRQASSLSL